MWRLCMVISALGSCAWFLWFSWLLLEIMQIMGTVDADKVSEVTIPEVGVHRDIGVDRWFPMCPAIGPMQQRLQAGIFLDPDGATAIMKRFILVPDMCQM